MPDPNGTICTHSEYDVVASKDGRGYRNFQSQGVPPGLAYPVFQTVELHQCCQCGWRRTFAKAADPMDSEVCPWIPPEK